MKNETGITSISKMQKGKSKRKSSYDKTGGNTDFFVIEKDEKSEICNIEGAGCIKHIWVTIASGPPEDKSGYLPRKMVIRMYWDGEETPSVEAPIGDFFGMGHGITKNFTSAPFTMSPEDGKGWNCYLPMPFADGARIEVENQSGERARIFFYVDYTELESIDDDELRFHAQWRREMPTDGIDDKSVSPTYYMFGGKNKDGAGNYVILEAEGKGHYIGCNYNVHNLRFTNEGNWYGEGDDMIFIDGDVWPPSLHGTGTEDYFNTAWSPQQEQSSLYHGVILGGGPNWSGKSTLYRYHILDPVIFNEKIKVTIEHGHNNHRSDDVSTTAYWYQTEPHMQFPKLPECKDRVPIDDVLPFSIPEMLDIFVHKNEEEPTD